ncbi:MAG: TrmH family RNA methyltransferase [Bdellovibrio sp.]|nr:MAG: TrmH family RNA methyltransferase [Bdellovibrio sp.]
MGTEFIETPEQTIHRLSPQVTPQRLQKMQKVIEGRTMNVAVIMENIYDRGNVSAVMRSAEAFGFINFCVISPPGSRFKKANRVTQGADKWLRISRYNSTTEALCSYKSQGFRVIATHLDAPKSIYEVDFTVPTALVFGNEKEGVSEEALNLCDETVIFPMSGFIQSFNISVAAALCLHQAFLNRKNILGKNGDLSKEEKKQLLAEYLLKDRS